MTDPQTPATEAGRGFPAHEPDCHCHAAVERYLAIVRDQVAALHVPDRRRWGIEWIDRGNVLAILEATGVCPICGRTWPHSFELHETVR